MRIIGLMGETTWSKNAVDCKVHINKESMTCLSSSGKFVPRFLKFTRLNTNAAQVTSVCCLHSTIKTAGTRHVPSQTEKSFSSIFYCL